MRLFTIGQIFGKIQTRVQRLPFLSDSRCKCDDDSAVINESICAVVHINSVRAITNFQQIIVNEHIVQ